jgi:predicted nucleotidyltransferase
MRPLRSDGTITPLLTAFVRWAAAQDAVVAVALVGSYARDQARPDSDVDLVVLTTDPARYRQSAEWVAALRLEQMGLRVASWSDEEHGVLWSRRLTLSSGLEVEVGFAPSQWAATDPLDAGTARVVRDGMRVLLDPTGLLHALQFAVHAGE